MSKMKVLSECKFDSQGSIYIDIENTVSLMSCKEKLFRF